MSFFKRKLHMGRHWQFIILFFSSLVMDPIQAIASSCNEDSISEVSEDGKFLSMLSGETYRVDDFDTIDSALWLPAEDVLVCGSISVEIINQDEDDEKVSAIRIQ